MEIQNLFFRNSFLLFEILLTLKNHLLLLLLKLIFFLIIDSDYSQKEKDSVCVCTIFISQHHIQAQNKINSIVLCDKVPFLNNFHHIFLKIVFIFPRSLAGRIV